MEKCMQTRAFYFICRTRGRYALAVFANGSFPRFSRHLHLFGNCVSMHLPIYVLQMWKSSVAQPRTWAFWSLFSVLSTFCEKGLQNHCYSLGFSYFWSKGRKKCTFRDISQCWSKSAISPKNEHFNEKVLIFMELRLLRPHGSKDNITTGIL